VAPQEFEGLNKSLEFVPPEAKELNSYIGEFGNAAQKWRELVILLWAGSTIMIGLQRILLREEPFTFEIGNWKISLPHPGIVPEKWVRKMDGALFSFNYFLISFLMVLQFIPLGKVNA